MENGVYTLLPGYESRPNPSPFKKRRTEASLPEGGFISSGSLSHRMSSEKTLSDCLEQKAKAADSKVGPTSIINISNSEDPNFASNASTNKQIWLFAF